MTASTAPTSVGDRARPVAVYVLALVVGAAAFLWPFFLPADALPETAHAADAPLVAAAVGAMVVAALVVELRAGTVNGATIALLGVLGASAGLLRLLDLPGGGSGMFFLLVLAGAAFGPRFGLLVGVTGMAVSAVVTGGIGPWLPFQMLTAGWMAGGAGLLGRATRRLTPRAEVATLAAYGWIWSFVFGAVMNLFFWPFVVDGGELSYVPGAGLVETTTTYWRFYVATSLGWDAAGAIANAVLIAITGGPLLASMRRIAGRLQPVVELSLGSRPRGDRGSRSESGTVPQP